MLKPTPILPPQGLRKAINKVYRADELSCIKYLLDKAQLNAEQLIHIEAYAASLVNQVRQKRRKSLGIDTFLTQYALSSDEGIALMCLAEAFLRIPDTQTINALIRDKISSANWKMHLGKNDLLFVNATTWGLLITGKILKPKSRFSLTRILLNFLSRRSELVVRTIIAKAMQVMSRQFVQGNNIKEALKSASNKERQGYLFSYDRLGEAALTHQDAEKYYQAYKKAIHAIGQHGDINLPVKQRSGISIKLSALHPRYQEHQKDKVMEELTLKVLNLAILAKKYNIGLTIDAEESERLDLSLDVIETVFANPLLNHWQGFGIAVQSYQKRAFFVLDWIADLARRYQRRIMVRLIKGAYWDSEIKKSQMQGLTDYPVFTRKAFTDVSFQACAKKLLQLNAHIYPQFATHNAYTVAMILELAKSTNDFEFQCLHGMGQELYEQVRQNHLGKILCRIYAPVGNYQELLPYLVRRLLENGANSSFVHQIINKKVAVEALVGDPIAQAQTLLDKINQNIPLPKDILNPERLNSKGIDLVNRQTLAVLQKQLQSYQTKHYKAKSIINGKEINTIETEIYSPYQPDKIIGRVHEAGNKEVQQALAIAEQNFKNWSETSVEIRAKALEDFAQNLEQHYPEFIALLILEAGKTVADAVGEIREAVDFCYYYAKEARKLLSLPQTMLGYTGELNQLSLHPRGVIVCISPWNFPLAIFIGQVVAALVTGNCVIAKPAEQTPMIAYLSVKLLYKSGINAGALQFLPGTGETVGASLVADYRTKGVIFTGSTYTARLINQSLANKNGPIVPLIAETGGQNAMIVDSSALIEQVVTDVIVSAFGSAGQRCSALRVLYVQEEIYTKLLNMLMGAMDELIIGDPSLLNTDVGPVIDKNAYQELQAYINQAIGKNQVVYQANHLLQSGYFIAPTVIKIDSILNLEKEIFGPVLHVISYKSKALAKVMQNINQTGYGLTLGIHSRISDTVNTIKNTLHAGNCYVNRNMIGAVVGVQPFGGEGLSGTGPKAGGPYYLLRLCQERTLTIDTTAAGGNASLMTLPEGI